MSARASAAAAQRHPPDSGRLLLLPSFAALRLAGSDNGSRPQSATGADTLYEAKMLAVQEKKLIHAYDMDNLTDDERKLIHDFGLQDKLKEDGGEYIHEPELKRLGFAVFADVMREALLSGTGGLIDMRVHAGDEVAMLGPCPHYPLGPLPKGQTPLQFVASLEKIQFTGSGTYNRAEAVDPYRLFKIATQDDELRIKRFFEKHIDHERMSLGEWKVMVRQSRFGPDYPDWTKKWPNPTLKRVLWNGSPRKLGNWALGPRSILWRSRRTMQRESNLWH